MTARCHRPPLRPRSGASPGGVTARDPDPAEGVLLAGRYRLVELAGRGATAGVWRAHDELLDRDVAVKRFRDRDPHDLAGARMAARVRHPNVTAVHDVVQHGGCLCLVMDYHDGTTLADLLRGGRRLPRHAVAALGLQLLSALRAVHEAGIVHCDVKPANLLVGNDGRLTLLDFGIAEFIGEEPTHPARRDGEVIGSPAYMAPELVRGEAPTPAADLWSLGATLYTALEGRPPFPHRDVAPTLAAVLHDPPSPTRRAGRLQPLLTRLLAKDPAERPSYDDVHTLLAEALPVSPALNLPSQRRRTPHPEPAGGEAVPGPADTVPQRRIRQA